MVDLLDALHYMFEDDMAPASGEQQEARQKNRAAFYTTLYGKPSYEWITQKDESAGAGSPTTYGGEAESSSPRTADGQMKHYDYIPPTMFDPDASKPFGDVLDAPLG